MNHLFKAMADPTRRKILEMLREKDLTAGEIAEKFDMTKPSISNHLKILKNAELIVGIKKGQYIFYSINTTVFSEVIEWIMNIKGDEKSDK